MQYYYVELESFVQGQMWHKGCNYLDLLSHLAAK